jgi:hypothetical protein
MRVVRYWNTDRAVHIGARGHRRLCNAGVVTVQKLDAIFSKTYKTDAASSPAWKAACRVERRAASAPATGS